MIEREIVNKLEKAGVITPSKQGHSIRKSLFSRWLKEVGLSLKRFQMTPLPNSSDISTEAVATNLSTSNSSEKNTKKNPDTAENHHIEELKPRESTIKNWRAGRPISHKFVQSILTMMQVNDPQFKSLLRLHHENEDKRIPESVVRSLRGYWEEFHYTQQDHTPKIAKGILTILSQSECFYTIYLPKTVKGQQLRYAGGMEIQTASLVFNLRCVTEGFDEELVFRLSYNDMSAGMHRFNGICSGLNFDRQPFATSCTIRYRSDLGKPSRNKRYLRLTKGGASR